MLEVILLLLNCRCLRHKGHLCSLLRTPVSVRRRSKATTVLSWKRLAPALAPTTAERLRWTPSAFSRSFSFSTCLKVSYKVVVVSPLICRGGSGVARKCSYTVVVEADMLPRCVRFLECPAIVEMFRRTPLYFSNSLAIELINESKSLLSTIHSSSRCFAIPLPVTEGRKKSERWLHTQVSHTAQMCVEMCHRRSCQPSSSGPIAALG